MNDEAKRIKELMEDLMELKRQLAVEKMRLIGDMAYIKGILRTCVNPDELRVEQGKIARLRVEREKAAKEVITAEDK